jgi:hypothetical protein
MIHQFSKRLTLFAAAIVIIWHCPAARAEDSPGPSHQNSPRTTARELAKRVTTDRVAPRGKSYSATVPDTLDLAEHAKLAINVLIGNLEPDKSYGVYQVFKFSNPPEVGGLTWNLPAKNARALPWMRTMCGSDFGLAQECGLMQSLLTAIADDGLAYVPIENDGAPKGTAYPYANGLVVLAALNWYQRDSDESWLAVARSVSQAIESAAIEAENRAYFPPESSLEPGGIWKWTMRGEAKIPYQPPNEPYLEQQGLEGCVKYEQSAPLRALVAQYVREPSEHSRMMLQRLQRFMLKPGLWEDTSGEGFPGNEHGVFAGHFHGNVTSLHALLELGIALEDDQLQQSAREGYDHARRTGVLRMGWFPGWLKPEQHHRDRNLFLASETCGVSDMLILATKLSDAGLGDYWDDVDAIVRNHLVAQQITDLDEMRRLSGNKPEHEELLKRFVGGFNQSMEGWINSTGPHCWGCCTANGSIGLYYAWHGITRFDGDVATVNLLLNRASPWIDIDSYLPYEGKVVLHNKQARTAMVRLPFWLDRSQLNVEVDGTAVAPKFSGNRVVIGGLKPDSIATLTFPVPRRTEDYTVGGRKYTLDLIGSTVIDVTPRSDSPDVYQYYKRSEMTRPATPMKTVERFVADKTLPLQ